MIHSKSIRVLFALTALLLTSLVSSAEAPDTLKVVCFGDSVTGVYYHTGGRRAYTDMVKIGLEQSYPKATITAINAGISGNTTVDALRRIDKDVLAHKPDVVTIKFGLNDMTRVSLDDYRANLKTIVKKCQAIDAQVILCTPNSVRDTSGRPTVKLEQYVGVIRDLAKELNLPLADCYATFQEIRKQDPLEWAFLMSDEIHPNMDGHKRIAETIVESITGKPVDLMDVPALQSVIPHTIKSLKEGKPIKILAPEPYIDILVTVINKHYPETSFTGFSWNTQDLSLIEIKNETKNMIRGKGFDLVLMDLPENQKNMILRNGLVPVENNYEKPEAFIETYSWILNYTLSFGYQEWDVVALHPDLIPSENNSDSKRNIYAARLIRAQDFSMIESKGSETIEETLHRWFTEQLQLTP